MTEFIFLPNNIKNVLARNKYTWTDFLHYECARDVFATNDIVFMLALNDEATNPLLFSSTDGVFKNALIRIWMDSVKNNSELSNSLSSLYHDLVLTGQANKEVSDRLFNNNPSTNENKKPYEIVDISDKCYGVLLEPGHFPNYDLSNKLIRDLIKAMYVYHSQSDIAHTKLFELYLKRL